MGLLRFLRAFKDILNEEQVASDAAKLRSLKADAEIEEQRSSATKARTDLILAESERLLAKAEILKAKHN